MMRFWQCPWTDRPCGARPWRAASRLSRRLFPSRIAFSMEPRKASMTVQEYRQLARTQEALDK
jgi:hypothetical protein